VFVYTIPLKLERDSFLKGEAMNFGVRCPTCGKDKMVQKLWIDNMYKCLECNKVWREARMDKSARRSK